METKAFFGVSGLTSTSANYICNIAKEFYTNVEKKLNNIKFYNETVAIIGSSQSTLLSEGWTPADFDAIEASLKQITDAKSLIAFLREAIKEKNRLYTEAQHYEDTESRNAIKRPESPVYLTEEDVIKTWTIGEQEKYLSLETECAVLGKYIHEDGAFNKARKTLEEKKSNPCVVRDGIRDTLVYRYTPTINSADVDDLFFKLQAQHREKQAELNGLKHKVEEIIKTDTLAKDNAYREESVIYHSKLQEITTEETLKRAELCKEVESLKIVIPNNLKDIYETISSLHR